MSGGRIEIESHTFSLYIAVVLFFTKRAFSNYVIGACYSNFSVVHTHGNIFQSCFSYIFYVLPFFYVTFMAIGVVKVAV